jgi:DNA-binding MarR family transcriptional regulator
VAGKEVVDSAVPVRWLEADEERAWIALTGVLLRLPAALDADLREHSGITHFEYLVLSATSEAPGRTLPMGELAALSYASPSRVSHVVARLEARGWITRSPEPGNRRIVNARLTPQGFEVLRAAAPRHVATVRHLVFDAVSGEQTAALTDIAHALLRRLDPEAEWPPRSTRVRP